MKTETELMALCPPAPGHPKFRGVERIGWGAYEGRWRGRIQGKGTGRVSRMAQTEEEAAWVVELLERRLRPGRRRPMNSLAPLISANVRIPGEGAGTIHAWGAGPYLLDEGDWGVVCSTAWFMRDKLDGGDRCPVGIALEVGTGEVKFDYVRLLDALGLGDAYPAPFRERTRDYRRASLSRLTRPGQEAPICPQDSILEPVRVGGGE